MNDLSEKNESHVNPNGIGNIVVRGRNAEELTNLGVECQIGSKVGMPKAVLEDITNQYHVDQVKGNNVVHIEHKVVNNRDTRDINSEVEAYIHLSRQKVDKVMSTITYLNDVLPSMCRTPVEGQSHASGHSSEDTVCPIASLNNFKNRYSVISQPRGRRVLYKSINKIVRDLSHQFTNATVAELEDVKAKDQNAHAEQSSKFGCWKNSCASVNNLSCRYVVLEPLKGHRVIRE
ncbi:hypothetical protein RIF29_38944 [Crotalaria pallida]|uniref:Uncharacterized protein n=1 Tax=Crotalaria pallida TaxID=3830 RepID=A0AAN9HPD6_CROPI